MSIESTKDKMWPSPLAKFRENKWLIVPFLSSGQLWGICPSKKRYVNFWRTISIKTEQTGNCDKKIDLAIVLDASASIGKESFKEDFAKALIRRLALSCDSVRVSLVASYSTHGTSLSEHSLIEKN